MKEDVLELVTTISEVAAEFGICVGFKAMISAGVAFCSYVFLPVHDLLPMLFILVAFDCILGTWRAAAEKTICSAGFRKGLFKIILYIIGVSIVCVFASMIKKIFGTTMFIDAFLIGFLATNELLSSMAHLGKLGFPVPGWLIKRLEECHDDPYQFAAKELHLTSPESHEEKANKQ